LIEIETPAMRAAFEVIGFTGLSILVIGWLLISFQTPSQRRERIEWISACGMYLALLSLFVHLSIRAYERDSHAAMAAFGFLVLFFTSGFTVCLTYTLTTLRGGTVGGADSATN
jgi:hypothetical protein